MKNKRNKLELWIFLFLFVCTVTVQTQDSGIQDESGFIVIEPVDFYFHLGSYFSRLALTSSRSHIWHTFLKADDTPAEKPLFVFFNGGPGGATSSGLMSMYTGRWTLDNSTDKGGDRYIANPVSWTRLGNLLYIDARQTGFSYDETANPQDMGQRRLEFNSQNYNEYIDAADFIRVLLRVLAQRPEIRGNPVIIVGESYGGIRATAMLYMLLNYRDFGNGVEKFQDPSLVDEIQQHYDQVFPAYRDMEVPPEVIATQWSHQILIQSAITRANQRLEKAELLEQEGSLMYQIAAETGVEYIPCRLSSDPNCSPQNNIYNFLARAGRDAYDCSKPADWLWGFFGNGARLLGYTENLNQITGMDAGGIQGLYASARNNAYRVIDPASISSVPLEELPLLMQMDILSRRRVRASFRPLDTGQLPLEATFGFLRPWDFYFLDLNDDANYAFWYNVASGRGYYFGYSGPPTYGRMFLKNVAHVKTFITNAKYDVVVYAPAIPSALARHTDLLGSARHVAAPLPGLDRPGRIVLNYHSHAFPDIPGLDTRTIRFPSYDNSCHAVSLTQPWDLFADVAAWLEIETGN